MSGEDYWLLPDPELPPARHSFRLPAEASAQVGAAAGPISPTPKSAQDIVANAFLATIQRELAARKPQPKVIDV